MLLKTLMPCYFRSGWSSRALWTEGQAFWAVLVVMATVSWTAGSSTNHGLFSPKTLCTSYLLVTRDDPRCKKGQRSLWPNPASSGWCESKGNYAFLVFKVKWRSLLPPCFRPRISEIENFKNTSSNNYTENILFYKAHAYAIVLGWFPLFFHGQCCVSVDRETPNCLHTSTPELRFLLHRWPRFKYVTLLIGSFLVALYLVGFFFFF